MTRYGHSCAEEFNLESGSFFFSKTTLYLAKRASLFFLHIFLFWILKINDA